MTAERYRAGFRLQLRPERLEEYRAQHAAVWPEMLDALRRCGWHNYSLFLDADGTLFGYVEADRPFEQAIAAMQSEPVNARWQELMGPYFAVADSPADQQMQPLPEVFHLP